MENETKMRQITINNSKLRKTTLLCIMWPFFYIVATQVVWAVVSNIIVPSDMTQRRLLGFLFLFTIGASLAIRAYTLLQILLTPLLELFRMSRPNGHYLVGQVFVSLADCLEQNEKGTEKYHTADVLAQFLACGKIGAFLNMVAPVYEISMTLCGAIIAVVIPIDSVVKTSLVFSVFFLCASVAGLGRRMVMSHIAEAGQISLAQNKE